jgi:L-serine dehydratase
MSYRFKTGQDLLELCTKHNMTIGEIGLKREAQVSNMTEEEVYNVMLESYRVMKESAQRGIITSQDSMGKLIGHNAKKMYEYYMKGKSLSSGFVAKAIAYSLAITEENARMGKIVACPTAGACGVVPAVLNSLEEDRDISEKEIVMGLFTASAVGLIIATFASISGAEGGCQAEVGSASAMAAAALVEIMGGNPEQALEASSIAIKNMLGLVCDPVGGLVEVPCSKRNAGGVGNAITAAEMALAGVSSFVPFDEVVITMGRVGRMLPGSLRETAAGGLAITKTAKEFMEKQEV